MEYFKKNIKCSCKDKIEIFFLGDIHEGARNFDEDSFKAAVKMIENNKKENQYTYVIGMGDYIDCINHKDPRFNPVEIATKYKIKDLKDLPRKQMKNLVETLDPIMNCFIGWLYGNHEEQFSKHNGYDPMNVIEDWYEFQGLKSLVLGYTAWINLGIIRKTTRDRADYTFSFDLSHGCGGGGYREGYPINLVHDVFRWGKADFNIMGHVHQMSDDMAKKRYFDVNGNRKFQKCFYGTNGCFLKKEEIGSRGYFEGKKGKFSSIGMLKLSIKIGIEKQDCKIKLEKVFI